MNKSTILQKIQDDPNNMEWRYQLYICNEKNKRIMVVRSKNDPELLKQKNREYTRKYKNKHPIRVKEQFRKHRAKKLGKPSKKRKLNAFQIFTRENYHLVMEFPPKLRMKNLSKMYKKGQHALSNPAPC